MSQTSSETDGQTLELRILSSAQLGDWRLDSIQCSINPSPVIAMPDTPAEKFQKGGAACIPLWFLGNENLVTSIVTALHAGAKEFNVSTCCSTSFPVPTQKWAASEDQNVMFGDVRHEYAFARQFEASFYVSQGL
jgi:hypothetical protein